MQLLLVYVYPFYFVFRGGSVKKGILLAWGLMVLYITITSLPFYDFIWKFAPELTDYMPEGNSVIGALMTGWFFGLLISLFALASRDFVGKIKKKRKAE